MGVSTTKTDVNHPEEVYWGRSNFKSLDEMTKDLKVTVYPEDKINAFPDPALGLGSIIKIDRAMPVTIVDDTIETTVRTWTKTVGDLLTEQGVMVGEKDMVSVGTDSPLAMNLAINITRVAETDVKQEINLPFNTTTKDDPSLEVGKQTVAQAGQNGTEEKVYHIRRENGVEVSRVLVSDNVISKVIDKIVMRGTKPKVNLISSGSYKDTINAAAQKYNINGTALYCLMMAESGGNRYSNSGYYKGLFQYSDGTWTSLSSQAGYGGASVWDPTAQIYTTAWALTHGETSRWPTWPGCKNK